MRSKILTAIYLGLFIVLVFSIFFGIPFSLAQAQERNAFTREEAIIFLNQKIDGDTDYNIGKWIIGHVEKYEKSHGPMISRATDNYQFQVAKNTTYQVENYQCAEVHTLFKPMKLKKNKKLLKINLCSKGNVITIILLNHKGI